MLIQQLKQAKFLLTGAIVLIFSLLLFFNMTQAATFIDLSITNTLVGVNCDTSEWVISFSFNAVDNNLSGGDLVGMVATDANGVAISADWIGYLIGSSSAGKITLIGNGNGINNITASPITIVVYDIATASIGGLNTQAIYDNIVGQGAPVLGTLVYNPNIDVPTCPAPIVKVENGIISPVFFDGRINDYDTAAPIAIYPHNMNDETGLIIYNADGAQLLVVSPQQIADTPDNPDNPVLIIQANGIGLYRINSETGGLWQINAPQYNGKVYVMIFPELFHSGGYESYEIEI